MYKKNHSQTKRNQSITKKQKQNKLKSHSNNFRIGQKIIPMHFINHSSYSPSTQITKQMNSLQFWAYVPKLKSKSKKKILKLPAKMDNTQLDEMQTTSEVLLKKYFKRKQKALKKDTMCLKTNINTETLNWSKTFTTKATTKQQKQRLKSEESVQFAFHSTEVSQLKWVSDKQRIKDKFLNDLEVSVDIKRNVLKHLQDKLRAIKRNGYHNRLQISTDPNFFRQKQTN